MIFRRNVEGGGRQDDLNHTSYRGVVGVKGDVGNWKYDVFAQVGRVVTPKLPQRLLGGRSAAHWTSSVAQPAWRCAARHLNGIDPNCVPYNIWSLGERHQRSTELPADPGLPAGSTSQTIQGVNLSTDLGEYGLKMPTSTNGVGLALGVGTPHRKTEAGQRCRLRIGRPRRPGRPDPGRERPVQRASDYFAETRMPILQKQPFADQLNVTASYRKSDYSTGQKTSSYGAGIEWAPIKEAKFRFSYQRAARAANVVELYTPAGLGLYDIDPTHGRRDPDRVPGPVRHAPASRRPSTATSSTPLPSSTTDHRRQYEPGAGRNPTRTRWAWC